jgi:hypothetical protein
MEVMNPEQTAAPAPPASERSYEQCDHCGAPVEVTQRYCVSCGTRRRHVDDPAARFLSSATASARSAQRPAVSSATRRRSSGFGLAVLLAVIPIAVGIGVLVGRASNNGDSKLIAALKAQKPQVITTGAATAAGSTAGGSGGTGRAGTDVAAVKSTFPLQTGYAIELQTIPRAQTTTSAVSKAEQTARAKGATAVGVILQSDFRISPTPAHGDEVIYSGAFHTQADATKALAKLKKHFPDAKVISVKSASLAAGAGKVLAKTNYGTAHQITGFHATSATLAQGRQVVDKVAKQIGGNYVGSQKNLPDQISVP